MYEMKTLRSEHGSASVFATIGAAAVIGMAAVVLDAGYMLVTRAELQNAADAAALSGNRELARIYEEMGNFDPTTYTLSASDKDRIYQASNSFAVMNEAANESISIRPADILYGQYNRADGTFTATDTGVTSIQVMARRDDMANGVVSTLLAGFIGVDDFSANADSGASVSPARRLPRGKIDFPVGISKHWFDSKDSPCGPDSMITFYPTGTLQGCAGWHTFENQPANADQLKSILTSIKNSTWESPEVTVGETYLIYTGGTVDSALKEAKEAYDARKDGNGEFLVHLPVYDRSDCSNPQGWIKVVGIATAVINYVNPQGNEKQIAGSIECDFIEYGDGGGPDYGTYVGLPEIME